MSQKKAIGFGFRGWMLILFQAVAYLTFQVFTQYPLNILADFYGGANVVSRFYSISAVIGIAIQIMLIGPISKLKNIKSLCISLGAVSLVLAYVVMSVPAGPVWYAAYAVINVTAVLYATVTLGLLVGQWFPTRKGTVMGIATLAFPIANGLLGPFANSVMGGFFGAKAGAAAGVASQVAGGMGLAGEAIDGIAGAAAGLATATDPGVAAGIASSLDPAIVDAVNAATAGITPQSFIFQGFLPFFIISIVGWLIGAILIKDYPEQVGAFRDNDRSMTAEVANQMMLAEIENKKTSVWKLNRTAGNKDFWLLTIPNSFLLGTAIGLMSQSQAIITNNNTGGLPGMPAYEIVMMCVMVFGMLGSFVLGLIDTRFGTKKAIMISTVLMILSGVFGMIGKGPALMVAMILIALFMGAASNFGLSSSAQYWRREDFGRVFMLESPITSLISSISPMIIAALLFGATGFKGTNGVFILVIVLGAISFISILLFNPKAIKKKDDQYRAEAGKPVDDELSNRK